MASKNLGAVIQRAISDGAFRRQLQSDPAAALRGFNLTPDEVKAIRSGDSSKLMSLGVDQRMSKAFIAGGQFLRTTTSDLNPGGSANTLVGDQTAGAREGIVGDPGTTSREAITTDASGSTRSAFTPGDGASSSDAVTIGNLSGTRAVNDSEPFDSGRLGVADPTISGTRAVNDSEPFDSGRLSVSDATIGGTRAVNDSEPFAGNAAPNDNTAAANAGRGGSLAGDMTSGRAVHDVAPFGTTGTSAIEDPNSTEFAAAQNAGSGASSAIVGDPYSGTYQGVSPDFQANLNAAAGDDTVSSRMADAGTAGAGRAINDVAPFDSGINAAAPSGGEFLGDIQHDPGTDATRSFIPSDSADVQRELLDGTNDGGALGNTGTGHPS